MRIQTEKTFNEVVDETNVVKALVTIYGNSSDNKPTDEMANGSVFIETDTLYIYMYDEENSTWRQLA